MNELINQAESLRKAINEQQKEIDNPSLILGIVSELDFFIENLK
ncbi:hypothetical protein ACUL41_14885 [Virgibacillus natechei]